MIGNAMKNAVAFQNSSSACGFCAHHSKKDPITALVTVPILIVVPEHCCPKNYAGSSKGIKAQAALDCVNQVWSHKDIKAFVRLICIDDDASTKAYL
jgi:hypothetical protein